MVRSRLLPALGLLALAAPFSACDTSDPGPSLAAQLEGSWRWVRAVDVETREVHTPATEGYTATLTLGPPDDEAGTYVYRRDDGVVVEGRYQAWTHDGSRLLTVSAPIGFLTETAYLEAGDDSLHLGGVYELGYEIVYAREP